MEHDELMSLIRKAESGDASAGERLFVALYDELHLMASRELRRNVALTISPTTLLHETYLNVSGRESAEFVDRQKFMAYAARAMRGLIIDYLRRGNAQKRGGAFEITSLQEGLPIAAEEQGSLDVEHLREALEALSGIDARLAECVDLKFFCGFSFGDIAKLWEVSERTVQRDWDKARLLLSRLIRDVAAEGSGHGTSNMQKRAAGC
jgi:RNA polymerase sigma factor (TIGR02999 family)